MIVGSRAPIAKEKRRQKAIGYFNFVADLVIYFLYGLQVVFS